MRNFIEDPYPSRRSTLLAGNGVVATSQPLAARAGLAMLEKGGNAVDAALATAMALTVVEPTGNGIGSDAFAIVWDGKRLHGLNGSGRWPAAYDAQTLREQGHIRMPLQGWETVSVPGAPAAWHELHQRFGRLSLAELTSPAIDFAEHGFPVSPVISRLWQEALDGFLHKNPATAGWRTVFTRDTQVPVAGERWYCPSHAACLRMLTERGLRDFYEGEVAERIVDYAQNTGGRMSRDDLAAHVSQWVGPIATQYREHEVWEIPPNGQGIAALVALAILEGTDLASHDHGSADVWHLQIEAMKLAFADVYRYVADPEHTQVPELLDPNYFAGRRALIGKRAGQPEAGEPTERRNSLSVLRRSRRHDGELHPIQLHGLWQWRRTSGAGHIDAKPCRRFFTGCRTPERSGWWQTAPPYDYSGFSHPRGSTRRAFRRDGWPDAAPGSRAGSQFNVGSRSQPPSSTGCAALADR